MTHEGGEQVGWVDLLSGVRTVEIGEMRAEFEAAVGAWLSTANITLPATNPSPMESAIAAPEAREAPEIRVAATEPPIPRPTTIFAPPQMLARPSFSSAPSLSTLAAPPLVARSPEPAQAETVASTEAPPVEWRDLASNKPGEMIKQKAEEVRKEAPVMNFMARVLGVHTDARAYRVGVRGEERVGKKLDGLPDGWHAIHSVPVGERNSDIDHVVIGPGGVFTLNTKNHPGGKVWVAENALLVNGRKTQYLRNSRFEATRAAKLLTAGCGFQVEVLAVLVFVGVDITVKARPADVRIVYREGLARWLKKLPSVLAADRVEAIFEVARRDVTWHS